MKKFLDIVTMFTLIILDFIVISPILIFMYNYLRGRIVY